ncbi:ABC transporter permease [Crossiella cryophila]|uniref:Transport permease protein n=1 Tax=Crossiella cryophila TaxID=43355 RepID=A0A7W7FSZ2_9PSEU|nr:ABC transporter permease [Crossiella cryophila]MBB4676702.1 ABC-2 type transport system permease protein [Crossiella cryophila]
MKPLSYLVDAQVMIGRNLRHIVRNPEQLAVMLLIPTAMLVIFRYMFGGAVATQGTSYVNYLIAGILVISVGTNSMPTAVGVRQDMADGIVDRFRAMPMLSSAVIIGHVAATVVRTTVSTVTMILIGLLLGFRPQASPLDWLAIFGLLWLLAAAMAWIAALFGLLARTVEGASGLSLILLFVPYASSAFVPAHTLPDWLRAFVEHQPLTLVMDTVRPLLLGVPTTGQGWLAVLWWSAILLVVAPLTGRLFRRRTAA